MNFIDFLDLLKRRIWIVLIVTLITTSTSFAVTQFVLTPIYANSTTLLVIDNEMDRQYSLTFNDVLLYEKLLGTYRDIILSQSIRNDAMDTYNARYDHRVDEHDFEQLNVITRNNSNMITIEVKHPDYTIATNLTNTIAESFSKKLAVYLPVNNVQIIDPAVFIPHATPVSPNLKLNVAVAFIIGIMFSTSAILLWHFLDTRIRSEEDIVSILEHPILGTIPNYNKKVKRPPFYQA